MHIAHTELAQLASKPHNLHVIIVQPPTHVYSQTSLIRAAWDPGVPVSKNVRNLEIQHTFAWMERRKKLQCFLLH